MLGRQRGEELEAGGGERSGQTEVGGRSRDADGQQRGRLLRAQPGEAGPVPGQDAAAAAGTGVRVDGHAGCAQRLEVSIDRADRDLELGGQLRRPHLAARLEQEQQAHEAVGAHRCQR